LAVWCGSHEGAAVNDPGCRGRVRGPGPVWDRIVATCMAEVGMPQREFSLARVNVVRVVIKSLPNIEG